MTSLSIEPERNASHGDDKDFAVFGVPRLPAFERPDYDPVPRLGGARVAVDMATRLLLLGEEPRDMPGGRVALNISPECGDCGCGVISFKVCLGGAETQADTCQKPPSLQKTITLHLFENALESARGNKPRPPRRHSLRNTLHGFHPNLW